MLKLLMKVHLSLIYEKNWNVGGEFDVHPAITERV